MRKILPIIIFVVMLLIIIFKGGKRHEPVSQDPGSILQPSSQADGSPASTPLSSQPSSEITARVTWPPLIEGVGGSALSTTNYYIVLDGSGSMLNRECAAGSTKIDAALKAIRNFVASVPADTNVGMAAFDRRAISERVPLGVGNRDALYSALNEVRAGSDTPLRSTIQIGYDKLTEQARTQLGYGEYHLVIVTDGNPDPRSEDPTQVVNTILATSPVVIHTIGFCINNHHVLNQRNRTYYASATSPAELQQGLQAVLAESPTFDADSFTK